MRRVYADNMVKPRHGGNRETGSLPQRGVGGAMLEEGAFVMSATAKFLIAAGAGAFAKWLFRGVFTWRSFVQMLGTVAIGGMAAVSVLYFIPALSAAPEAVQWAIAGIIGSVAGTITERIETVHFSAKAAGMEFESNGDEHK